MRASGASEPRERRGACGAPRASAQGGSAGAKPPGSELELQPRTDLRLAAWRGRRADLAERRERWFAIRATERHEGRRAEVGAIEQIEYLHSQLQLAV